MFSRQIVPRKPAASVWHYSKQREKLKHLMKNTPCICGAGQYACHLIFVVVLHSSDPLKTFVVLCGVWWLSGKFGALRPEGREFESHSSHHVGTLGKSFTRELPVALRRVNSDTVSVLLSVAPLSSRKRNLKRRYRNIRNK